MNASKRTQKVRAMWQKTRVGCVFRSYKIRESIFGSLTEAKSKKRHVP